MNKEELHKFIEEKQPNICQVVAYKNNEKVYSDCWNNYKEDDCVHIMSATKSIMALLIGIAIDKNKVNILLEKLELKDLKHRKVNELSGGQKQRVAIARALIKNPKVILADEPTGNLDSTTGKQVMDLLKEISKEKLVIIVSHDKESANTYGDRIIEIKDGGNNSLKNKIADHRKSAFFMV